MEFKIKGSVAKKQQSTDEDGDDIKIGDILAVFIPNWNKWVRGKIKARDINGSYYVWAMDYGIPVIAKPSHVVKLPPIYAKMNSKCHRVRLAGLINCVPCESTYDIEKDNNVLLEKSNWSEKALEIAQNFIGKSSYLKFDGTAEVVVMDERYIFGQLKAKKSDGTWIDLAKCLSNALVAKITTDDWRSHIHRLDSINQKIWRTPGGVPLQMHQVILPIASGEIAHESDIGERENVPSVPGASNQSTSFDGEETTDKKKSSAKKLNHPSNTLSEQFGSAQPMNGRYGNNFRNLNFNNHRPQRNTNWNPYSPNARYGWMNNNMMHDRRYRADVEFFESSFRKPNNSPIKKEESSSDGEDSNGKKNRNEDKTNENETATGQKTTENHGKTSGSGIENSVENELAAKEMAEKNANQKNYPEIKSSQTNNGTKTTNGETKQSDNRQENGAKSTNNEDGK